MLAASCSRLCSHCVSFARAEVRLARMLEHSEFRTHEHSLTMFGSFQELSGLLKLQHMSHVHLDVKSLCVDSE